MLMAAAEEEEGVRVGVVGAAAVVVVVVFDDIRSCCSFGIYIVCVCACIYRLAWSVRRERGQY